MLILEASQLTADQIKDIAASLASGAVIVFPTDTSYGIGCDATNKAAVNKIFAIKGREKGKALPMIVADLKMAKSFFRFGAAEERLAKKYWPGPLSIVLPTSAKGIAATALLKGTAVVRVPESGLAVALSSALGKPLIATSANRSGEMVSYSVGAFLQQFRDAPLLPQMILDGGPLKKRKPSTIVKVEGRKIIVLRPGPIQIK